MAAFGVLARLARRGEAYPGLAFRSPVSAAVLGLALLSLAGLPVSIGFFGKFYVIAAGIARDQWLLVAVLIAGSVIGLFYYLRVLAALVRRGPESAGAPRPAAPDPLAVGVLVALAGAILVFGVYPAPLVDVAHATLL